MTAYNNVLVAVDLLGDDEYLIEHALRVAGETATVRLIYVAEVMIYPADMYLGNVPEMLREDQFKETHGKLGELAGKYDLSKEGHLVAVGRPANEIHKAAQEQAADLIVVGSHGRHGIQLVLGSTSNAVLHGATCDVLAVRLKD